MVSLHEPGSRRAVGGIAAALSHRGGELTVLRLQDAGRLEVARRDRRQRWAAWQDLPNDEPLAVSSGVAAVDIGRGAIVVFAVRADGQAAALVVAPAEGPGSTGSSHWSLAPQGEPLATETALAAVSRGAGRVAVSAVSQKGVAVASCWSVFDGWSAWAPLAAGIPAPATPVSLVASAPDCIDAFTVASDGGVLCGLVHRRSRLVGVVQGWPSGNTVQLGGRMVVSAGRWSGFGQSWCLARLTCHFAILRLMSLGLARLRRAG